MVWLRAWVIGSRHFFLCSSTLEDENTTLLRNVGMPLPIDAVLCLLFNGEVEDALLPFEDKGRSGVFDEVCLFVTVFS
jgi:hypothetical protein